MPAEALTKEFGGGRERGGGLRPVDLRELGAAGVKHFYISNLPIGKAAATLRRILTLAA